MIATTNSGSTNKSSKPVKKEKRQLSLLSLWGQKKQNLDQQKQSSKSPACNNTTLPPHGFDDTNVSLPKGDDETIDIPLVRRHNIVSCTKDNSAAAAHHGIVKLVLESSHHDVSATLTAAPSDSHVDEVAPCQPSEYESLRLRNIERNNARLRELGLLSNNSSSLGLSNHRHNQKQKRQYIKKRKPIQDKSNSLQALVVRRSTRLLQCNTEGDVESSYNAQDKDKTQTTPHHHDDDDDDARYLPLYRYRMSSLNAALPSSTSSYLWNWTNGLSDEAADNTTTLSLQTVGPRLIPPSGLNAIYSLQFASYRQGDPSLIVGGGKSGIIAVWDIQHSNVHPSNSNSDKLIDPILSWKAHSGRWISSTVFIPSSTSSTEPPQLLMTAGNDGCICVWDISTVNASTGVPRLNYQSGKDLHTSGIFSMDVLLEEPQIIRTASSNSICFVCTGSKDKSVALSEFRPTGDLCTTWRSTYHTNKVGVVRIQPAEKKQITLVASASDDGRIAIHDVRTSGIVTSIQNIHAKPHSVEWSPSDFNQFVTAGLDETINLFDLRNSSRPMRYFCGHSSQQKIKSIHRPVISRFGNDCFLITGGEGTSSISIYNCGFSGGGVTEESPPVLSRGLLPQGCGDTGSIAVLDHRICVSTASGEVLLLAPTQQ